MSSSITLLLLVLLLVLKSSFTNHAIVSAADTSERKLIRASDAARVVPEQYLIQLRRPMIDTSSTNKPRSDAGQLRNQATLILQRAGGGSIQHVFTIIHGVSVQGVDLAVLQRLLDDEQVELVQEDEEVELFHEQASPPNWSLDRMDQPDFPLDDVYHYNYTGRGVKVFIIDSGLLKSHQEFAPFRATCGFNAIPWEGPGCIDGNGHGTHVAGIIAGRTVGVAKEARVVSVKVVTKRGITLTSLILSGVEYVFLQRLRLLNLLTPMVVNMSLGFAVVKSLLNQAVNALVRAGVFVAVAAGNSDWDACTVSPASAENVVTVGASARFLEVPDSLPPPPTCLKNQTSLPRNETQFPCNQTFPEVNFTKMPFSVDGEDSYYAPLDTRSNSSSMNDTDARAFFSNWGPCVDIFAPGRNITSAWADNNTAYRVLSGTSMASPHVAGVAALYFSAHRFWSPEKVWNAMKADALTDMVQDAGTGSPNLLLSTRGLLTVKN